ncbi:hypothetical protein Q1695_004728 [Nippostrongylus brasiliensis]|nr:hypothetical protein Q1695_004728 [Nippostrongylus brasiliensis]
MEPNERTITHSTHAVDASPGQVVVVVAAAAAGKPASIDAYFYWLKKSQRWRRQRVREKAVTIMGAEQTNMADLGDVLDRVRVAEQPFYSRCQSKL